jgi:hypothetical protein
LTKCGSCAGSYTGRIYYTHYTIPTILYSLVVQVHREDWCHGCQHRQQREAAGQLQCRLAYHGNAPGCRGTTSVRTLPQAQRTVLV